jgi:hypothetical protein
MCSCKNKEKNMEKGKEAKLILKFITLCVCLNNEISRKKNEVLTKNTENSAAPSARRNLPQKEH